MRLIFSAKFNTSTLKGQAEKKFLYLDIFAVKRFSKAQRARERKKRMGGREKGGRERKKREKEKERRKERREKEMKEGKEGKERKENKTSSWTFFYGQFLLYDEHLDG